MTYNEAKKYLDENKDKVPNSVSLFIAPKDKQAGETNLKSRIGDEENRLALEEFGFIDNTDLEVYAIFQEGERTYYPTLSYYFQTNQPNAHL
jgi:hypothetical protein